MLARPRRESPTEQLPEDVVGRLHRGDAAEIMADWPDACIDLIVTSPPYWTAVKYGGARDRSRRRSGAGCCQRAISPFEGCGALE